MHAEPEVSISLEVLHITGFALCYFRLYVCIRSARLKDS